MTYNIKAIETMYKNTLFRSRLEARWAAFFDLCGWEWSYEPADFNGWFPDFCLFCESEGERDVYVEVKPVSTAPLDVFDKIDKSGCSAEVLVVGIRNPFTPKYWDACAIGWLREDGIGWDEAIYRSGYGYGSDGIGFCHTTGSFRNRISGHYDGNDFSTIDRATIKGLWSRAGNLVQWKKG